MDLSKLIFVITFSPLVCSNLNIISRGDWGGRPPKVNPKPLNEIPAPFVVVHHSDGSQCLDLQNCKLRVKGIQNYHMDHNKWDDIGYNFLIGGDGNIYEGRGWGIKGSHCPKFNSKSIGICLIGNYMIEKTPKIQLDALRNLMEFAASKNYIKTDYHLVGHRQGKATFCPGDQLYNEIKKWPHFDSDIPVV